MTPSDSELPDDLELVQRAGAGDARSLNDLFDRYRDRLKLMVRLRLDPRIQGRVDPSDVVQETFLAACRKLPDYLRDPKLPFLLWLRLETGQNLALLHRKHLGVKARNAGREVSLDQRVHVAASSLVLATQLMGTLTGPCSAAMKKELKQQVHEALVRMDEIDREVLVLRHFEHLTNSETAMLLGIKENTACNRYVRALERLRHVMQQLPDGEEERSHE